MKKVIIMFLIAGFFAGCHSGKKKSSKHYSKRSHYTAKAQSTAPKETAATASSSNVSRINSPSEDELQQNQPMTRIDSLLGNTGTSRYYSSDRTNYQGASGAGTGSSYASGAYAAAKQRKAKKRRVYNEDELNPDFIQSFNKDTANVIAADTTNGLSNTTNTVTIGW